ncbi:MAG: pyrroline-5-carboxylate reductase, partial [Starkeya sp.]|nr:pyrroline-5-carboxylate reductase [Starkeya sp.]
MAVRGQNVGLIGAGQLGGAIGAGLLRAGVVVPGHVWVATRSGPAGELAGVPGVNWTADVERLAARCEVILLALPPAAGRALRFAGAGRLVVSVMAGVRIDELIAISGGARVVRAMSSPAAALGMAYSPFFAGEGLNGVDRERVR